MSATTETTDYAVCTREGCRIALPTPEDARKHGNDTMEPTGATTGVTARGHGYSVLNPTRDEQVTRMVGFEIDQATTRAFEALDSMVDEGRLTREEITKALRWYPDFSDGWSEWNQDGAS